jgi:hypothetical protein
MADSAQVNVIANIKEKATECQTSLVGEDMSKIGALFFRDDSDLAGLHRCCVTALMPAQRRAALPTWHHRIPKIGRSSTRHLDEHLASAN